MSPAEQLLILKKAGVSDPQNAINGYWDAMGGGDKNSFARGFFDAFIAQASRNPEPHAEFIQKVYQAYLTRKLTQ